MDFIFTAECVLGAIALAAAVILFLVGKKFVVHEDPRLETVTNMLPGANCGGCGFPGCSGMASALVTGCDAGSVSNLYCPVGGDTVMCQITDFLGLASTTNIPQVATVKCNGSCAYRPRIASYDGWKNCKIVHANGQGETGCGYGCLGCGDCVEACHFDALHMTTTGLPEVDGNHCVGCGACVEACPRKIIELRVKKPKNRQIFVACSNKDKGAVARKSCEVACIGCGKCEKVCSFDAIKIEHHLSYIDSKKCRLCTKCVDVCPTSAILKLNFPIKKETINLQVGNKQGTEV